MLRLVMGMTLLALALLPDSLAARGGTLLDRERLLARYHARHDAFADQLSGLALDCESRGLTAAAASIRALTPLPAEADFNLDNLPPSVGSPANPAGQPGQFDWEAELRAARQLYADDLFLIALEAIRQEFPRLALDWIRETAFHDPDHELARERLGWVRYGDRWVTPFTALMLRRGYLHHERFGWLPADHVDRYEQGERFWKGRWVPADREPELRKSISMVDAWEVESDHFVVRTNHSLERGVELSAALEDLHRFFIREFAEFFATRGQMTRIFDDGKPLDPTGVGKHEVWYFRTREEYQRYVRAKQKGADLMTGFYMPRERRAYFFAAPDNPQANIETLYHEVTHQLLSESNRKVFEVGEASGFWAIEGIACYMESFNRGGERFTVGDPMHSRIYFARERIVAEDWFMPLEQFTHMGRSKFQAAPAGQSPEETMKTWQRYYSQATGLTHFLLHYENGRYRDGFVSYLTQLYSPDSRIRGPAQSLDEAVGVTFDELNRQYVEYVRNLPTGGTESQVR
ncbi:MAG: hypothetical protein R3B90_04095 [Planctomycetaceae bacterium]